MKILSSVWQFINLAFSYVSQHFANYVQPAITIIEAIKAATENHEGVFSAEDSTKELLSKVITTLRLAQGNNPDELIAELIDFLRQLPLEARNAMYHKLASAFAQAISPIAIAEHEADLMVQVAYVKNKIDNQ